MAKRFINTEIFSDSWFSELSPQNKLFYVYLFTNCDHAGIIDLNPRLAEFETGIKGLAKSMQTVTEELGNRLVRLRDNYYCLPKFVKFQYPKGLNTNVKAQLSVVNRLAEFDLDYNSLLTVTKQLSNSSLTVQDKDIDKDIEIKTQKKKDKIILPDWISQDSWDGFVEMRKKIKKPLTDRACTGIINKLDKFGRQNANAILDQSTENCWQTVYELKEQPQQTGHQWSGLI